jgi:choline dehydrogenase-like flavoprotein
MSDRAVIVGSGAGASITAMVLAEAGWDVVVLERGPWYITDLDRDRPTTLFSSDELKGNRYFEIPDPLTEPRAFRAVDTDPDTIGDVNQLAAVVGGGTVHWDAKTPRFWDIDFKKLSLLGPVDGADVADWPFSYAEIAPYYLEVERLLGVQGPDALPATTLAHAPGQRGYEMPPGPQQFSSMTLAAGFKTLGMHPYAFPMAINSQPYDGRPACNDCGQCSGYGCPISARLGALAVLKRALATGRVTVRDRTFVSRIVMKGTRATGVEWIGPGGRVGSDRGDLVVMAGSAIETSRLALLSHLPDAHGRIGRDMMFHNFIDGFGIFLDRRMHAHRGRSTTQCCEDFCDPDYPGARQAAKAAGLPYIRGGILELGGSQDPMAEAGIYRFLLESMQMADPTNLALRPFGTRFKALMRASILRDRLAGASMVGEDLPYATNRVDLASVKDYRGVPVARLTYSVGKHETVAAAYFGSQLTLAMKAAGATVAAAVPESLGLQSPIPHGAHVMGGMRMGSDPRTSVTDGGGIVRGTDNVLVADGSVFPTSGAHNPTLTIMATALRNVRRLVHSSASHGKPSAGSHHHEHGGSTGAAHGKDAAAGGSAEAAGHGQAPAGTGGLPAIAAVGAAATVAGFAVRRAEQSLS